MGLKVQVGSILREFPRLWNCLKSNTYPSEFLANALGFSAKLCEHLPQYLMCFVGVYLLCAGLTLFLRFRLEQKPLSSIPRQIHNGLLTICCTVLIPILFRLGTSCAYIVCYDIKPYQEDGSLVRYIGDAFSNIIYVVILFTIVLSAILGPAATLFRYLKVYGLRGLPHAILEIGTGPYLVCIIILATAFYDLKLYSMILPASFVLGAVQCEGYLREEEEPVIPSPEPVRPPEVLPDIQTSKSQLESILSEYKKEDL